MGFLSGDRNARATWLPATLAFLGQRLPTTTSGGTLTHLLRLPPAATALRATAARLLLHAELILDLLLSKLAQLIRSMLGRFLNLLRKNRSVSDLILRQHGRLLDGLLTVLRSTNLQREGHRNAGLDLLRGGEVLQHGTLLLREWW